MNVTLFLAFPVAAVSSIGRNFETPCTRSGVNQRRVTSLGPETTKPEGIISRRDDTFKEY